MIQIQMQKFYNFKLTNMLQISAKYKNPAATVELALPIDQSLSSLFSTTHHKTFSMNQNQLNKYQIMEQ